MAHKLEKLYNAFKGTDTRSNRLQMDPKSLRAGTKNIRFDFQDDWTKANGFQHNAITSGFTSVGDIEYKYTDVDSGESKTQELCVGNDGNLYKKESHFLKFSSLGSATAYSFYYDEVANSYIFSFTGYVSTITVSDSMTMDQLRIAINAIGPTCTVVDDNDDTVTGSTKLAYLMDVVIDKTLTATTITETGSSFWTVVDYPSKNATLTGVPFITSKDYYTSDNYEGISFININNDCYITDGGFPLKYDGKQVYRAGVPKVLAPYLNGSQNFSGFSIVEGQSGDGLLEYNKNYQYVYRYAFIDANGAKYFGSYDVGTGGTLYLNKTITATHNAITHTYNQFDGDLNFPVYACRVNGSQNIADAGGTINVDSGHNIKAGMLMRIPVSNALIGYEGYSYIYSRVSAVTATTIALEKGKTSGLVPYPFNRSFSLDGTLASGSPTITDMFFTVVSANFTNGSPIITGIPTTENIRVGDRISGSYIPAGTYYCTKILSSTSIEIGVNANTTGASGFFVVYCPRVSVGMSVTGTGVPANTTVLSVNPSGSAITLSNNVSVTGVQTLTFSQYTTLLFDDQVLNAGYAEDIYSNTITNPNLDFPYVPELSVGAFMELYRTTGDGSTFYKVLDLPILNNRTDLTFTDFFSDDELSRLALEDAEAGGDLPRACKYLTKWQQQIVQAGRPVDSSLANEYYPSSTGLSYVNLWNEPETEYLSYKYTESHLCDEQSVYWNDPQTSEGFPQDGQFEFLIESALNDRITGIAPNKDALFALKERSTGVLVGSLAENTLSLEILETDAGCCSHRTIQDISGALVWLDAVNGFFSCVAGRLPENIGWDISDYQKINPNKLDYTKAVSANFRKESLYICAVGSTMFVYDFEPMGVNRKPRNAWYIWDRFNTKSLLATANDELFLSDGTYTWKMKTTNTRYDDTDHKSAINAVFNLAWINHGHPTIDKHYSKLWINSIQGGFNLTVKQYGNYLEDQVSSISNIPFVAESADKKTIKEYVSAAIPKLSAVSFGLENNEKNKLLKIQGIEIEFSADFDTGEPKR